MPEEVMIVSIIGIVFGFFMLRMILAAIFGAERMGCIRAARASMSRLRAMMPRSKSCSSKSPPSPTA